MTMITSQDILKLPMKQYFQPKQMTWLWANMTRKEIKNADDGVHNVFKNGKNSTKKHSLESPSALARQMAGALRNSHGHALPIEDPPRGGGVVHARRARAKKSYEETERHIAAGKYSSDEDSDGERIFRKKRKIDRSDEVTPLTIMIIVIVVMIIMIVDIVILHVDAIAVRKPQLRS